MSSTAAPILTADAMRAAGSGLHHHDSPVATHCTPWNNLLKVIFITALRKVNTSPLKVTMKKPIEEPRRKPTLPAPWSRTPVSKKHWERTFAGEVTPSVKLCAGCWSTLSWEQGTGTPTFLIWVFPPSLPFPQHPTSLLHTSPLSFHVDTKKSRWWCLDPENHRLLAFNDLVLCPILYLWENLPTLGEFRHCWKQGRKAFPSSPFRNTAAKVPGSDFPYVQPFPPLLKAFHQHLHLQRNPAALWDQLQGQINALSEMLMERHPSQLNVTLACVG